MTVTVEEAKVSLAQMLAAAEAGEEVLIGPDIDHQVAKLVPIRLGRQHIRIPGM